MIRHVFSVLCSGSSIDKDENKLSLFDVFEQVTLLQPFTEPGVMPIQGHLVTVWRRENLSLPAHCMGRVRVLAPDGTQVGKTNEYTIDLSKFSRLRQRVVYRTLPVRGEGTYEFVVEYLDADQTWVEATRVPLDLAVRIPSPEAK